MPQTPDEFRGVWTLAEVRQGSIHPVSLELLAWGQGLARKLGVELASVVLGHGVSDQVQSLIAHGADKVYLADDPILKDFAVEPQAGILTSLVKKHRPEILLGSATTTGRTLLPILAVTLNTGLTADCTGLDIDLDERLLIQTRPAIGGNVMATIKTPYGRPQMATVRPKSLRPLSPDPSCQGEVVPVPLSDEQRTSRVRRLEFVREKTVGAPLQDAETVVACGKGIKDPKNLKLLEELAQLLGGSLGATRKAIDLGWLSYSHQIGLSGKTLSPRLYLGCGVSGAVQHLAGITSSEKIAAINSDPDAPIFQVADLGVVGDLFQVLPQLIQRLRKMAEAGPK
jgi:electron transfer flavoprotein alpha subunit